MPSIQSIIFATAVILDSVAGLDAVIGLVGDDSIASAVRIDAAKAGMRARKVEPLAELVEGALVEHSDFSDYRRSNSHRRRNMKRATLNTEEMT